MTFAANAPAILWVTDDLGTTGGSVWSYLLSTRWRAEGCRVSLFHLTGTLEGTALKPPPELALVGGASDSHGRLYPGPTTLLRLARVLRHHDVVIVGTTGRAPVVGFALARLTGTPVVAYSQGLVDESLALYQRSKLVRRLLAWCLRRVDAFFAVTPESMVAAIRLGVPADRVAEVRTGIDLDEVRARAGETATSAPPVSTGDVPLLVAVGTLEPRKGQDRILEAVARLRQDGRDVRLSLIGPDGGTRSALEAQARDLAIDDLVSFAGYVSNPLPLVARADVLVHAAHSEIVGLVLLEAVAVGTPVVAHDCQAGGPRLVLDGGRLGALTDAADPALLAKEICEALALCSDRRRRVEAAEAHVREQFSPAASAAAGLGYLRRIVAGQPVHERPTPS